MDSEVMDSVQFLHILTFNLDGNTNKKHNQTDLIVIPKCSTNSHTKVLHRKWTLLVYEDLRKVGSLLGILNAHSSSLTQICCMMGNSASVDLNGSEARFIRAEVKRNHVTIFAKNNCCFSQDAILMFKRLGVEPTVIDLHNRPDGQKMMKVLTAMTRCPDTPVVCVATTVIGGHEATEKMYKSGELLKLINEKRPSFR